MPSDTTQYVSQPAQRTCVSNHPQLSIGYHMRRASSLDTPEWLAVTARAAKTDPYVALNDICICIPRLLERTDKLTHPNSSPDEIDAVISDSQALANRAFEWLSDFEKYGPRYDKVPIDSMEGFLDNVCGDLVFDPVFNFHYFGAGICYMIYWMSMLILQGNTFRLLRTHRALEPTQLFTWGWFRGPHLHEHPVPQPAADGVHGEIRELDAAGGGAQVLRERPRHGEEG